MLHSPVAAEQDTGPVEVEALADDAPHPGTDFYFRYRTFEPPEAIIHPLDNGAQFVKIPLTPGVTLLDVVDGSGSGHRFSLLAEPIITLPAHFVRLPISGQGYRL